VIQAIVFDFDGVIADSEPMHFAAFRDVLAEAGVELTERDYYARYLGFDDDGALRHIAADRAIRWSDADVRALAARKAARFAALEDSHSILFPGAAATIRRAAADVPIAIASGARADEIIRVLTREGIGDLFSAIVAAGDTAAGKPSPDPYLAAVERLRAASGRTDLDARRCVAVEDSAWGIESARAAGLRVVAVAQSYDARTLADADLVVRSIAELDLTVLHSIPVTSAGSSGI
jgi:HAD superfamily hydrolase (TIGR01509 family)